VIRDIGRRIAGNDALQQVFARELSLARRVRDQDHRQRGPKVYSLHAPEVECIGKGNAHRLFVLRSIPSAGNVQRTFGAVCNGPYQPSRRKMTVQ
jgi:hypothetical protein